ncbi:hypothetical protein D9M69_592860 [compost metagenome]
MTAVPRIALVSGSSRVVTPEMTQFRNFSPTQLLSTPETLTVRFPTRSLSPLPSASPAALPARLVCGSWLLLARSNCRSCAAELATWVCELMFTDTPTQFGANVTDTGLSEV